MKYVFIVHSHTLFLTAMGTVDALGLDPRDILLIYTRGYRTVLPARGCGEWFADGEFARFDRLKEITSRKRVKEEIRSFDRMADERINDEFELFVPHLWSPFFKLLQTSPRCTKVSLIQEGAFTVESFFHNRLSPLRRWKHRLGEWIRRGSGRLYGNGWYTDGELCHQDTLDAYAVYPEFFRYLDCRQHLVQWPSYELTLPDLSDGTVFIFDGFTAHGVCSPDFYLIQCRRMMASYASAKNYLRFHPAQKQEEREKLCAAAQELGLLWEVTDETLPFELQILSGRPLTVAGMGSSLLYFARARGHRVICCDTWLLEDPLYLAYHNQGVPLFDE